MSRWVRICWLLLLWCSTTLTFPASVYAEPLDPSDSAYPALEPPLPLVNDETPNALVTAIDSTFTFLINGIAGTLFFEVLPGAPFIVVWLVLGAIFLTLRLRFISLRGFRHALHVVRGRYDSIDDTGEVSHLQALWSALSATVGLGNIAGVAIAVSVGGPGALFWMMVAAFFGMTSKFVECTLGVKYRQIDENGRVLGGPMRYLQLGFEKRGFGGLGRTLAVMFTIMCILGSFGGGNMFQINQAYASISNVLPFTLPSWLFGVVMMGAVGIVIVGGIKRIAQMAEALVPFMCVTYLLASSVVLIANMAHLPATIGAIFGDAFAPTAVAGGVIGAIMQGFKRAAFSNEAGIGTASIAHSAARTNEPVREGTVALLEPFLDTIIICMATGLVIVSSGVLQDPSAQAFDGSVLTAMAFATVMPWFPIVLSFSVLLFAYSTVLSWSYYGERCWAALFNNRGGHVYKALYLLAVFIGAVTNPGAILTFSDLMILCMAFPNMFGLVILSGEIARDTDLYYERLRQGVFALAPGKQRTIGSAVTTP